MKRLSLFLLTALLLSSCATVTPAIGSVPKATTTLTVTPTLTSQPTITLTPTITPTPFPLTYIYQDDVPASARTLQEQSANKAYAYFSKYAELGAITIYSFSDLELFLDEIFPAFKSDIPPLSKSAFRSFWPATGGTVAQNIVVVNTSFYAWQNDEAICYKSSNVAHEMFHIVQSILMEHALFRPELDYGPEWLKEGSAQVMGLHIADGLNGCSYERDGIDLWSMDSVGGVLLQNVEGGDFSTKPKFWSVAPLAVDYLIQISPAGEKSMIDYYSEVGAGTRWPQAFLKAFGISKEDFYKKFAEHQKTYSTPTPTAIPAGMVAIKGKVVLVSASQKPGDFIVSFCNSKIVQCLPGHILSDDGSFVAYLDPGDYKISVNPLNGGDALGWYTEKGLVPDPSCAEFLQIVNEKEINLVIDFHSASCPTPTLPPTMESSIIATGTVILKDNSQRFSDFLIAFCNIEEERCLPGVSIKPNGTFSTFLLPGKYRISINSLIVGQSPGWYTNEGLVINPTCAKTITVDLKHEIDITINLQWKRC